MNNITEAIVTIFSAIIGVAILSVLVSSKANTSGVIQAAASGFANTLGAATAPVSGNKFAINTAYPSPMAGGVPQF